MNDVTHRALVEWLREGPEHGPREGLERALDATRGVRQPPGWAIPERWFPMQLAIARPTRVRLGAVALLVILLLAALVAAVVVGSRPRVPAPFGPADNGLVAYDAGGRIYLAESDGSQARELLGGLGYSRSPSFSPDGTKIAFWSAASSQGTPQLFVMDVSGAGQALAISDDVRYSQALVPPPSWAPDGRHIAIAGQRGDPASGTGVYLASADGSGITTVVPPGRFAPWTPVFSPDGSWIAFRSDRPEARLVVVRPDGSDLRVLATVDDPSDAFVNLAWSLDGRRIVYHRPDPATAQPVVETVDLDGAVTRLSRPGEEASDPSWSPDGELIAYAASAGGGPVHRIVARPDGTGRRDLGAVGGCVMGWSPDSAFLFGYTSECFSSHLTRIPIDDPSSAITLDLPGATDGMSSWQRVASD
jgi:Tol biopolymer transport system component